MRLALAPAGYDDGLLRATATRTFFVSDRALDDVRAMLVERLALAAATPIERGTWGGTGWGGRVRVRCSRALDLWDLSLTPVDRGAWREVVDVCMPLARAALRGIGSPVDVTR